MMILVTFPERFFVKVSLRQDIPSTGVFFSMVGVAPESQGVREVSSGNIDGSL